MKGFLCVELKRAFALKRFLIITVVVAILMIAAEYLEVRVPSDMTDEAIMKTVGISNMYHSSLQSDSYTMVYVVLLSSLCVGSFCKDYNSRYLRVILGRTDTLSYTISKFLAHLMAVSAALLAATIIYVLYFYMNGFSITAEEQTYMHIFADIEYKFPLMYILMLWVNLSLNIAVFGAMGMAFSAYQPNSFISLGIGALLFFLFKTVGGYFLGAFPLNIQLVMGMTSMSSIECPQNIKMVLEVVWDVCYLMLLIVICAYLFYQKLERRRANGNF